MPRYDFKCRVCHEVTEAITPINESTIQCPVCNKPDALIIAFADRQLCCPATIHIH